MYSKFFKSLNKLSPSCIAIGIIGYTKYNVVNCQVFEDVPKHQVLTGEEFNRHTSGQRKFKFLATDMIHYGLRYKEGLNVMHPREVFNNKMCESGLHFTSGNNLYAYTSHGIHLYEVAIPNNAMVICDEYRCKASELILERRLIDGISYDSYRLNRLLCYGITDKYFLGRYVNYSLYNPEQIIEFIKHKEIDFVWLPSKYISSELYEAGIKNDIFKISDVPSNYRRIRTYGIAVWYIWNSSMVQRI